MAIGAETEYEYELRLSSAESRKHTLRKPVESGKEDGVGVRVEKA